MQAAVLERLPVEPVAKLVSEYLLTVALNLRTALQEVMNKELISHLYDSSRNGRQNIVLEYVAKGLPTVAELKRDILELFGTYEHVYDDGEPPEPSMKQVEDWMKGFYEKKTGKISYYLKDIEKNMAEDMFVVGYMMVTCKHGDEIQGWIAQMKNRSPSLQPSQAQIEACRARHERTRGKSCINM